MAHQPINKKNNCHIGRGNRFCYKASTGDHFQKDTRVTHTHIFQCIVTVNMHIVTFPRATHSTPQGNLTFCIYIKKNCTVVLWCLNRQLQRNITQEKTFIHILPQIYKSSKLSLYRTSPKTTQTHIIHIQSWPSTAFNWDLFICIMFTKGPSIKLNSESHYPKDSNNMFSY